jgi:putative copper export protein/methionine-rich copper-binding protein CopC
MMMRHAGARHTPPRRRGMGRGVLVLLALLAAPSVLLAHQHLRVASPAHGATLDRVPGEITLTFSEPVRLEFTEVVVQGPEGALDLGAFRHDVDDPRTVSARVNGGWHAGEFAMRWTTVGSDGHRTQGTVSFVVAEDAAGLPVPEPSLDPDPAERDAADAPGGVPHHDPRLFPETPAFGPGSAAYVTIRALLFMALIALLGAVSFRFIVLPIMAQRWIREGEALRDATGPGAARVGLIAAAALVLAAVARLWAQSASLFGTAGALDPGRLGQALSLQPWATGFWLQIGAGTLAFLGFALARRRQPAGWALAAVAALVAAVTPALSGHAVSLPALAWLAVPVDTIHVLAAGGWIGSLFVLVVVGIPAALSLERDRRGPAAAALVHAFSPAALAFTATLLTTGVLSAWLHLGDVAALWTTPYGRTLLLKVAIFSAVAFVGAYNFLRVRPALGEEKGAARLRRSGVVELALALVVLVVTAVLVAVPPPAD